ncbi:MAG: hypothetical protein LUE63_02055, partial [Lachnospiraceae bacterium]|nr:hypothetical protein [Lachnospiraceae bacterium]
PAGGLRAGPGGEARPPDGAAARPAEEGADSAPVDSARAAEDRREAEVPAMEEDGAVWNRRRREDGEADSFSGRSSDREPFT